MKGIDGIVCLGDSIEDMSDVVVNRKIPIAGLLNKVRHILATLKASKAVSFHDQAPTGRDESKSRGPPRPRR
jgi:hypothetical protein